MGTRPKIVDGRKVCWNAKIDFLKIRRLSVFKSIAHAHIRVALDLSSIMATFFNLCSILCMSFDLRKTGGKKLRWSVAGVFVGASKTANTFSAWLFMLYAGELFRLCEAARSVMYLCSWILAARGLVGRIIHLGRKMRPVEGKFMFRGPNFKVAGWGYSTIPPSRFLYL